MAKLIALDDGHGMETAGKRTPAIPELGGRVIHENEFNREVVKYLDIELKRCGFKTLLVAPTDADTPLSTRTNLANSKNADAYISIHYNAFDGKFDAYDPEGLSVHIYPGSKEGRKLAECVLKYLKEGTPQKNRGIVESNFYVLRETNMPAILSENGFMDNKREALLMLNVDFQKEVAREHAKGICDYFGVKYVPESTTSPTTGSLYRVQTGAFKIKSNADKLAAELKKKGFDTYIVQADGLFKVQVGAYTVKANAEKMLKELQKAGFKGFITETNTGKPKEIEKPLTKPLSEYYEKYGLKIIETDPDNIYVAVLPGKSLREFGIYGINGTWQNTPEAHLPRSVWGLAGNGNKAIGPNSHTNSPNGHKRGTIIYYEDGTLEIKRINHIKEITKPFKWCIGGGSLIPNIIDEEKFPSDIYRFTHHTGIGYKGNRIYLIVTSTHCSMAEFRNRVLKLELDKAIFLDGGGSTQMNYVGGKGVDSSRKLSHGIFLKKV